MMTRTRPVTGNAQTRFFQNYRNAFILLLIYSALALAVTLILFPIFWMVSSSLKPADELFARNLTMLPVKWTLENYRNVWQGTNFPTYFWNSFKVAALSTIFSVCIAMYAAYAIARIQFPGRYAYGLVLLVTQMFPHILIVIPLYLLIQRLAKPAEMLSMPNVIVLTAIAFLVAGVGIALGERITGKIVTE